MTSVATTTQAAANGVPGGAPGGTPAKVPLVNQRSASVWQMLVAQTAMELRLTLRRGESVLVTLVIPPVLLIFLSFVPFTADTLRAAAPGGGGAVGRLLPGILALAVMSTAMVSLGIATAYERYYGVLKRLGGSPLPRPVLIVAKLLSVAVIEAIQAGLLVVVALAFGWRPGVSPLLTLVGVLLGTAAFGGFGLWMAGTWRAEATLAGANGLYLLLLLFGGLLIPPSALPPAVGALSALTPSAALADVLRAAFGVADPATAAALGGRFIVLLVWALLAPALAARLFRWE